MGKRIWDWISFLKISLSKNFKIDLGLLYHQKFKFYSIKNFAKSEFHHQQNLNSSTLKVRFTDVSYGDFQNSYFLGCTIVNNQINSRPLKLPKSDSTTSSSVLIPSLKVRTYLTEVSDGDFQNSYCSRF